MAQYTLITEGTPMTLSNGITEFRYENFPIGYEGSLIGYLRLKQNRTATSFSGTEGVDWDDIEEYIDEGGSIWRVGVRNDHWVMDCTITGTGFSGAENTDWINVESHKLPDEIFRADSTIRADTTLTVDKGRL